MRRPAGGEQLGQAGERNPIEELIERAQEIRAANPPINVADERHRRAIEAAEAMADDEEPGS